MYIGVRSHIWIHMWALPAAFAKPVRVLRGWHPHPARGYPATGLGELRTPLSPHLRGVWGGTGCFELRLVVLRGCGKGRGSAAAAVGAVSEPPCSRLGGLDLSSPVRSISSPGSSRHRHCRVLPDVSRAARGRRAAGVGQGVQRPLPPGAPHRPSRMRRARMRRVRLQPVHPPVPQFPRRSSRNLSGRLSRAAPPDE